MAWQTLAALPGTWRVTNCDEYRQMTKSHRLRSRTIRIILSTHSVKFIFPWLQRSKFLLYRFRTKSLHPLFTAFSIIMQCWRFKIYNFVCTAQLSQCWWQLNGYYSHEGTTVLYYQFWMQNQRSALLLRSQTFSNQARFSQKLLLTSADKSSHAVRKFNLSFPAAS